MTLRYLIPSRFWTRRCHGCGDTSPHDSHLTWIGRFVFRSAAGGAEGDTE